MLKRRSLFRESHLYPPFTLFFLSPPSIEGNDSLRSYSRTCGGPAVRRATLPSAGSYGSWHCLLSARCRIAALSASSSATSAARLAAVADGGRLAVVSGDEPTDEAPSAAGCKASAGSAARAHAGAAAAVVAAPPASDALHDPAGVGPWLRSRFCSSLISQKGRAFFASFFPLPVEAAAGAEAADSAAAMVGVTGGGGEAQASESPADVSFDAGDARDTSVGGGGVEVALPDEDVWKSPRLSLRSMRRALRSDRRWTGLDRRWAARSTLRSDRPSALRELLETQPRKPAHPRNRPWRPPRGAWRVSGISGSTWKSAPSDLLRPK